MSEQEKQEWITKNNTLQQHFREYYSADMSYKVSRRKQQYDDERVRAIQKMKTDLNCSLFRKYCDVYPESPFAFDECIDSIDYTLSTCISEIDNISKQLLQD